MLQNVEPIQPEAGDDKVKGLKSERNIAIMKKERLKGPTLPTLS